MPIPGLGGLSALDTHLAQTLARGTDSRNKVMIGSALVLLCVIKGDSLSKILREATWLVVAVIVLILAQAALDHISERRGVRCGARLRTATEYSNEGDR
ncbi:hypothetical protein [Streptomyces sp. NPDC005012]|uniref:hypothetical protein n=1 Tax=Streptomyces sp. NPDC005012 TaxID=3154558 RepID=UPI0033A0224C